MIPLHDDNPTQRFPFATVLLIVACAVIFLWQITLPEHEQRRVVYALGFIPAVLFDYRALPADLMLVPSELTLLTSMFLHGGWMHLIGNLAYLWIFGNNVEDKLGLRLFVVFYLLCGFAAAFAQAWPDPESIIPMIGASGAISGVLGAYMMLFPRARILVLLPLGIYVTTVRLPALLVLGLWFVLQLLNSALSDADGGGVAWGAHIGGFLAGMLLIVVFRARDVRVFRTS